MLLFIVRFVYFKEMKGVWLQENDNGSINFECFVEESIENTLGYEQHRISQNTYISWHIFEHLWNYLHYIIRKLRQKERNKVFKIIDYIANEQVISWRKQEHVGSYVISRRKKMFFSGKENCYHACKYETAVSGLVFYIFTCWIIVELIKGILSPPVVWWKLFVDRNFTPRGGGDIKPRCVQIAGREQMRELQNQESVYNVSFDRTVLL